MIYIKKAISSSGILVSLLIEWCSLSVSIHPSTYPSIPFHLFNLFQQVKKTSTNNFITTRVSTLCSKGCRMKLASMYFLSLPVLESMHSSLRAGLHPWRVARKKRDKQTRKHIKLGYGKCLWTAGEVANWQRKSPRILGVKQKCEALHNAAVLYVFIHLKNTTKTQKCALFHLFN